MDNLEFLPTSSSKIYQLGLTRLECMRGLACSGEPVEFSGLNGLFADFRGYVVEDDSGVGSRFEYVEPFIFGAMPVWDGRGVVWRNGYEVDASLSETAGIAEIQLVSVDGLIQGV